MKQVDNKLPDGVTREKIHHRQIDLHGYRRSDGLFEVEGRISDRKPHDFHPPRNGRSVPANTPLHDMVVVLVFNKDLVVQAVRTSMNAYPYATCSGGGDSLQALVGLRIGAGWNAEVRKRLPVSDTCTHMRELLGPMATAAFQTTTETRRHLLDARKADGKPVKVDTCYAYSASRDLVKQFWPDYYQPPATAKHD